ncbi:MAG: Gfo/Idh/MocA family protein [Phocaeicola sp.]
MKEIRVGVVGVGYRGSYLIRLMQNIPAYRIVAVMDVSTQMVLPHGIQATPYSDLDVMLTAEQLDLVCIASPWEFHFEQALKCLEKGVHIALEVKGELFDKEYFQIKEASQKSGTKVYPLENMCFAREIMSVGEMVRAGLFGEIITARGGYYHDIRPILVGEQGDFGGSTLHESSWRYRYYQERNADIYPTHGIAPITYWLGIQQKDRFKTLHAFASKSRGIKQRIVELGGESHPDAKANYAMSDIITSIIETTAGVQVILTHDTTLPRPREFNLEIQGVKGIWKGENRKIYIEHQSPYECWEEDASYIDQYEHPLWRTHKTEAYEFDAHHSGMDYIMLQAIVWDATRGIPYPLTIEDQMEWSSITTLSERSIKEQRLVEFDR